MSNLWSAAEYRDAVARHFLSMASQSELRKIMSSSISSLDAENQALLLSCTIYHPLAVKFPPSVSHSRLFLKWLMQKIEETGNVISEKLYIAYADLMQNKDTQRCYQHYILNSELTITLEASRYLVNHSTTGLIVWEAAKWLADWCMENSYLFKSKNILELGSGLGLTGLVVCQTCSIQRYIFSDNSPEVLEVLQSNISLNGQEVSSNNNQHNFLNQELTNPAKELLDHQFAETIQYYNSPISVVCLDWKDVTTKDLNEFQADTLLAADVFYDPTLFDSLVRLFHMFLTSDKKRKAYIACTERNSESLRMLSRKIAEMNLMQKEMEGPQKLNFIYSENIPFHIYEIYS